MNAQIFGLPGAGKTSLVKTLAKNGVQNRSSYRAYSDVKVLVAYFNQVAFRRKRTSLQDMVLRIVDDTSADLQRECMDYWTVCSQEILSLGLAMEQTNLLLKRLTRQIAIWGRLKGSSEPGVYDDHFYQNVLSLCALRQADITVVDLLCSTPVPDVAIIVEGDPEACFRNMLGRRRGPPAVLANKGVSETMELLERCSEVVSLIKNELPKLGVKVISSSDYGTLEELIFQLGLNPN